MYTPPKHQANHTTRHKHRRKNKTAADCAAAQSAVAGAWLACWLWTHPPERATVSITSARPNLLSRIRIVFICRYL